MAPLGSSSHATSDATYLFPETNRGQKLNVKEKKKRSTRRASYEMNVDEVLTKIGSIIQATFGPDFEVSHFY